MHNHINRNVRHRDKNCKKVECLAASQDLPICQITKQRCSLSPTGEPPKSESDPKDTKWLPYYGQNFEQSTDQPGQTLQDTTAQQSISSHDRCPTDCNDDDVIDPPTEECDHASYSSDSTDKWVSSSDSDDTFYQCSDERSELLEQMKTLSNSKASERESLQTSQSPQGLLSPYSLKYACIKCMQQSTDQPGQTLQDTTAQQSISSHDHCPTDCNDDDVIDPPTEECDHASYSSDSTDKWVSSSDSDDTFYQCSDERSELLEQMKTLSNSKAGDHESSKSFQTSRSPQDLQSSQSLKNACIKMSPFGKPTLVFALVFSIGLIMGGLALYPGESPNLISPLNLASPTLANKTSTALIALPGPPDPPPKCPIRFRILPCTFENLLQILEFYHHVKVATRLREHKSANATEVKHEPLNATHQTKEESLLPIPSRPRIYNYSVCSMRDVPPILTCHPWEAPSTRMCPAPDITNSTNSTTVHVDTKPLGVFVATPHLPMYLLSHEWKSNTVTSVLILPAPSSKPPATLPEQKPVKPPKRSTLEEIREHGNTTHESVTLLQHCVKWVVYEQYFLVTVEELLCFVNYHFQLLYSNATMIVHFLSFTLYAWVRCYVATYIEVEPPSQRHKSKTRNAKRTIKSNCLLQI